MRLFARSPFVDDHCTASTASAATRRPGVMAGLLVAGTVALSACGSGISLDEPIESRIWRLTSLGLQPVSASGDLQRDAQIQFDGLRVSGSGGCNRLTGGYQRDGRTLKIGPIAATRMACPDADRDALESSFVGALQATASYSLVGGNQLTLLDAGGRTLAVLQSR